MALIKSNPKYFMKYCLFTKDGNSLENPCRQFPYEMEYMAEMIEDWTNNRLFICHKSRQMVTSLCMLGLHLWLALTGPDREIYLRRQNFDDANKLLEDMKYMYDHIPEDVWPKELLSSCRSTEGMLTFEDLNTKVYAVSSGKDKLRGRTPTAVLLDEYAFQDDDAMVYQTIKPALQGGARISIISTSAPLFGGDSPYFRKIFDDLV